MKRMALIVGVDQYKDEAFRKLRYSVADAPEASTAVMVQRSYIFAPDLHF